MRTSVGLKLAMIVVVAVTLSACGKEGDDSPDPTIAAPTEQAAAGLTSTECWTADDVVAPSSDPANPTPKLQWGRYPTMVIDAAKAYTATFSTNKGAFTAELFAKDAPLAVNNLVCLAGAGYYNNSPFHRILADFVIQGGDPTVTGRGGPGYSFDDEAITRPYEAGILAMANSGPNTNGSQFFVIIGNGGSKLEKKYTIFGKVTSGMDVVDAIGSTPTDYNARGEKSAPVEPIVLQSVTISES